MPEIPAPTITTSKCSLASGVTAGAGCWLMLADPFVAAAMLPQFRCRGLCCRSAHGKLARTRGKGRAKMAQVADAKGEYPGIAWRNDAELAAWLAKRPREAALEPGLPIIDPHHHLWDTPQRGRYLLHELLDDIGGGHNIVATVFVDCRAMYRKNGPPEMAPLGEVEFVNGVAAMSASGNYGPCRVAAAIVSHADLLLGARVRDVLEAEIAAGGGRFRGIRHGASQDPHPSIARHALRPIPPQLVRDARFREGFAQLAPLGLTFES